MRKISKIIIHCTDSEWADAEAVRSWHLERGFSDIGYHFLIGNGFADHASFKTGNWNPESDGLVMPGRPLEQVGAHARGHNRDSIGICLVGREQFSGKQFESLTNLVKELRQQFDIGANAVIGHCELNPGKTCPNLPMDFVRSIA